MQPGIQCKACGASLYEDDDMELCRECMAVVFDYNKDLMSDDDKEDWFDIELQLKEETYEG